MAAWLEYHKFAFTCNPFSPTLRAVSLTLTESTLAKNQLIKKEPYKEMETLDISDSPLSAAPHIFASSSLFWCTLLFNANCPCSAIPPYFNKPTSFQTTGNLSTILDILPSPPLHDNRRYHALNPTSISFKLHRATTYRRLRVVSHHQYYFLDVLVCVIF